MRTFTESCTNGTRHHGPTHPEPGFNVCDAPGCEARHRINLPTGQPRSLGRFIDRDECADLGLLIATALLALRP